VETGVESRDILLLANYLVALLTHAVVPSVDLHVLGRTHARVVAQGVVAGARPADPDVRGALVDIYTQNNNNNTRFSVKKTSLK